MKPGTRSKASLGWRRISSSGQAPNFLSNISMAEANGIIYIFGSTYTEEEELKSVLWVYDTSK